MRNFVMALALTGAVTSSAAQARKDQPAWQVLRATDPITRVTTCSVAATDHIRNTRFTMTGGLYPVVEMSSTYGLLVGVSSGGRIRMPTGDILWVVDDKPYRTLRAAENPGSPAMPATSSDAAKAIDAVTAYAMQLARSGAATSTMASGVKAREMLDEMLQGRSLLFRAAGWGQQTGLPDYSAMMAGQINEKGELHPVPLDTSFRAGLQECAIIKAP
jgi:hypothetical protein